MKQEAPFELDAFGLRLGEMIRWRRRTNQRWVSGSARGVNQDGSLRITDDRTGAVRNLRVDKAEVERHEKGPRGGEVWHRVEWAE